MAESLNRELLKALKEYMASLQALTSLHVNGPPLIERSPTRDRECFDAWIRLNNAGKQANEVIAKAEAQ